MQAGSSTPSTQPNRCSGVGVNPAIAPGEERTPGGGRSRRSCRVAVQALIVEQVCELVQNDRDGDERVGRVPVPGIAGRTLDVPFRERFMVPSASAD